MKRKRILSGILALVLMVGMLEFPVMAEDIQKSEEVSAEITQEDMEEEPQEEVVSEEPEAPEETPEMKGETASGIQEETPSEEIENGNALASQSVNFTKAEFNTANIYAIRNYGITTQSMLLKVPGNKNGRVMPMIISPADHSTGELYTFTKVNDWFTMTPECARGWRVNVEGEQSLANSDIGLWTNTNHSTQGWYFERVGSVADGYVIRSANNPDMVLDIRGTTTGKGVKINTYSSANKCQIWIIKAYTASISMKNSAATTSVNGRVTLGVKKMPVDAKVTWSSASNKIATVSSSGVVTGKSAGTTTIYAKCYGKTTSCKVTVKKSSLSVASKLQKTTITKGSCDGVSGTVKSNQKITKVTGQIIGKGNKKVYYSKTVKPNATSYKLTGAIDNAMKFNKLPVGNYIFRVTAWDKSGNKAGKDIGCTVQNGKNKKLGIVLYSQNDKKWASVRIGRSSSTIGKSKACPKGGYGCTLTCIAMAERYMQKNDSITPKIVAQSTNDFSGDLVNWKGTYSKNYKTGASKNLKNIYAQISAGKPVILGVSDTSSKSAAHWVLVYGYKNVTLDKSKNPKNLKTSNFLIRDPAWTGRGTLNNWKYVVKAVYRK